jgi:two-component system, cell cycle sensor histidine kinase DivJ
LTFQSKVDEGTTVTVTLPLAFSRPPLQRPSLKVATLAQAVRSGVQDETVQVKKSA